MRADAARHHPSDGVPAGQDVPVAASRALAPVLDGPRRALTPVSSSSAAVHLDVDAPIRVVSVVTADAVASPGSMVVGGARDQDALAPLVAAARHDGWWIGEGVVAAGDQRLRVVRWWDPRPRLAHVAVDLLDARTQRVDALVRSVTEEDDAFLPDRDTAIDGLGRALDVGGDDAFVAAAAHLVGRGRGFTPAGDDVLAGCVAAIALLGTRATSGAPLAIAGSVRRLPADSVMDLAWARTSTVSAAWLAHALRGEVVPEVATVLVAMSAPEGDGRDDALDAATRRLMALGHSSGRDIAAGLVVGAAAVVRAARTRVDPGIADQGDAPEVMA